MNEFSRHTAGLGRRRFLQAGTGLGLGALGVTEAIAQAAPWAAVPKGKVDKLNFVVWTYGDIYTKIGAKFKEDWGVTVDSTISSFNDHPPKLLSMFAAGESVDVSQSSPYSFWNFVAQGLVEPVQDMPGAADYVADMTDMMKTVAVHNGKLMAMPYFSTTWVWNYFEPLLEKAKFTPFKTYEELMEQLRKAKKDKIAEYPIFWVAGVGLEQLPGTWMQMTHNRGGAFFDKAGNHQLGAGSIARETLKWWVQTFTEGLADPESLKQQFVGSAKAFAAGTNLYRGPSHHYTLQVANDPTQSPNPGKIKVMDSPGDGRTIGTAHVYFVTTANRNKEWAWKLLQYLGGRTKDGQYHQAVNLANSAMLGSGYNSVMNSEAVTKGWAPFGDVPKILEIWKKTTFVGEVCNSMYQPWHFPWSDRLNIEVQKALTGQITADACCDNLIAAIAQVKRG